FCSKKHWKLSAHNTGTADADFNELKRFIIKKAENAKRKIVYNKERAIKSGSDNPDTIYPIIPTMTPTAAPKDLEPSVFSSIQPSAPIGPAPALDPITELTKQFSQLAGSETAFRNLRGSSSSHTYSFVHI